MTLYSLLPKLFFNLHLNISGVGELITFPEPNSPFRSDPLVFNVSN